VFTSCTSPVVYDGLKKGIHNFTVRATDAAGNTGEEDQFTWTVNPTEAAKAKTKRAQDNNRHKRGNDERNFLYGECKKKVRQ
jgi:hypothetical protein